MSTKKNIVAKPRQEPSGSLAISKELLQVRKKRLDILRLTDMPDMAADMASGGAASSPLQGSCYWI